MKIDMDMAADSQMAINEYLHCDRDNNHPHDTLVTVKQNSEVVYQGNASVWAKIETNDSFLCIDWKDDYLDKKYWPKYVNKFQEMEYDGNCLIIFAKDRNKNDIEISIS